MSRVYLHRYKVLSGPLRDQVFDGREIGYQDYPDSGQFDGLDFANISLMATKKEGIWLNEPEVKINQTNHRDVTITDEGVAYSNDYMDLCVPFDRFNKEIFVGDTIYISSKNEVIPCIVEKIAKKPFQASYGIMNRKLTVRPIEGGSLKTINDPRSTVKA